MTKQRDFKARIRARMDKTGESYTAARTQLLKAAGGYFPDYPGWGGDDIDVAVTQHALQYVGVRHGGKPLSEAMLLGLGGGIGFAYFTFEYKGHIPTMTVMMRRHTMPGALMAAMLPRAGVEHRVLQTTSARKAEKDLREALQTETAVLCTVGSGALGYDGGSADVAAMSPQQVAVVGIDGERAWLDDRPKEPVEVPMARLTTARGVYRKAKHRLIAFDGQLQHHDLPAAVERAIADTVEGFTTAPYKNWAANFGLRGMDKLADALEGRSSKKSWQRLFATDTAQATGRLRLKACLEQEYTSGGGGRPLYADFLDEAATLCDDATLRDVASGFRQTGAMWTALGRAALETTEAGLSNVVQLGRRHRELLKRRGHRASEELTRLTSERAAALEAVKLPQADDLYAELGPRVREIRAIEAALVEQLMQRPITRAATRC